jgi:hypothetical protein
VSGHPRYTLRELEGVFMKRLDASWQEMDTLEGADGLKFLCPLCYHKNGGPVGTHVVICWFVGRVPDDETPGPGRWTPRGTGLDDLTFVPSEGRTQSVLITGHWHGYVTDGGVHGDDETPAPSRRKKNPEYET